MIVIGKNKDIYTEWEMNVEKDFNHKGELISEVCYYTYKGTISKDIEDVKKRFPNANFDRYLRGRMDFHKINVLNSNMQPLGCFNFGKYVGRKFNEVTDVDYLIWYKSNLGVRDEETKEFNEWLVSLDNNFVLVDGFIHSRKEVERENEALNFETEVLSQGKPFEFVCQNSLDEYGCYGEVHGCVVIFENYKVNSYKDMLYALPTIKGKAKRIKGNTVIIKDYNFVVRIAFGLKERVIYVTDWEIKKVTNKNGSDCNENELCKGAHLMYEVAKTNKVAKADVESVFFENKVFNGVKVDINNNEEFAYYYKDLINFVCKNIAYYTWRDEKYTPTRADKKQFKEFYTKVLANKYFNK